MRLVDARVALLAAGLLAMGALAGCSGDPPEPVVLPGGTHLVASWTRVGGIGPVGLTAVDAPRLVVYSDGQAIAESGRVLTIGTDEVTTLVQQARAGVAVDSAEAENDADGHVADGQNTTIAVLTPSGGMGEKSVYALDIYEDYPRALRTADETLSALYERVMDSGRRYEAGRIRLMIMSRSASDPVSGPLWPAGVPVPTQPAKALSPRIDAPSWVADLSGAEAAATIKALPNAGYRYGGLGEDIRTPDGRTVTVVWRYLLPHE